MLSPSEPVDPFAERPHIPIRPTSVTKAVAMLWFALGLGALRSAVEFKRMADDGYHILDHVVGQVSLFGCLGILYFLVGRRRNWARRACVAWTVLFFAMMVYGVLRSAPEIPFAGVLGIGQAALQLWALVLLFQPEAAAWFRRVPTRKGSNDHE
jgi:hypothetical protein